MVKRGQAAFTRISDKKGGNGHFVMSYVIRRLVLELLDPGGYYRWDRIQCDRCGAVPSKICLSDE